MDIRGYLRNRHVPFSHLLHSPMPSAARRASSIHVTGARVAKAVLVRAGSRLILAVLPATHRIDFAKLAKVAGVTEASLAPEDDLESIFTDCERGAIPPFGRLYGLETFVDASLAGGNEIVVEANTRHDGLRLRYRDFEVLEQPIRARFADPIEPRRRRVSHRRAG